MPAPYAKPSGDHATSLPSRHQQMKPHASKTKGTRQLTSCHLAPALPHRGGGRIRREAMHTMLPTALTSQGY